MKNYELISNPKLDEETISTQPIFEGNIITLQVDTVRMPDGNTATREVIKHPGAVAVLALNQNKMLVVEQYRQPMHRTEVEIPAGKLDKGEDPLAAAHRELQEETGLHSGDMRHLKSFYTSPGFADEIIHMYVTENAQPGDMSLDEDEFLEVSELTLEEAYQYIADGRIADAKTIMAVYAWHLYTLTGQWH
ncbi:NUDIX domain-containing protein [Paenibacillus monticola]|uniref:NUDIX domain-containing protein n=1 Tax=Paenibacillus monticola TaxID=2666075 RepID=A0A7X2H4S6_9BACL|nr:NUDIX hydrolase [Paenibacillus monticola]MRN53516.1 NUDIX domain-containing protein [Paenibacillus monticola]